jgi:hypothetical protein
MTPRASINPVEGNLAVSDSMSLAAASALIQAFRETYETSNRSDMNQHQMLRENPRK